MGRDIPQLLKEAVRLKLNMAELYLSLHKKFPSDADFWLNMAIEKSDHAALLISSGQDIMDARAFLDEIADVGSSHE